MERIGLIVISAAIFIGTFQIFFFLYRLLYRWKHAAALRAAGQAAEQTMKLAWDTAYNQVMQSGKTPLQAAQAAINAVNAGQVALKVWDDAYKEALKVGNTPYASERIASAATRADVVAKAVAAAEEKARESVHEIRMMAFK